MNIPWERVEIKVDGPVIQKTDWEYKELPVVFEDHIGDCMPANDTQVGGDHYKIGGEEHWDRAWRLKWDPFQYQITKYVERWKNKNGLEDLKKAQHFLDKYIELVEADVANAPSLDEMVKAAIQRRTQEIADAVTKTNTLLRTGGLPQTNYPGYTYEGGTADWDMYKHQQCKYTFKVVPVGHEPVCPNCFGLDAGPSYVNPDR